MNTIPSSRRGRQGAVAQIKPLFSITPQLIAGILLLTLGIVVLVLGTSASHAAHTAGTSFAGRLPHTTVWYALGGFVTGLVGLLLLLLSLLTRRT